MKCFESIVFEDNHLLVVNKKAGISTQPDLCEEVKFWLKEKYKKPGKVFLEPIHRLDKPVSGLVLFAKTSKALSRLQQQMRERKILKIYRARLEKLPDKKEGELKHWLIHDNFRARIDLTKKIGKESVLKYKVLNDNLVEIHLITGRYHQIRAQFSAIGCPIIGDLKYGAKKDFLGSQGKKIALEHYKIGFERPVKSTSTTVEFLLICI